MNLSGMDLTGINLRAANLQNAAFDYATLDGADLRSIVAVNATFIHAGNKANLTSLLHFFQPISHGQRIPRFTTWSCANFNPCCHCLFLIDNEYQYKQVSIFCQPFFKKNKSLIKAFILII